MTNLELIKARALKISEAEILPPEKDCCFECKNQLKYQTCRACNDDFCKECYSDHECD